jgi:hypothetical protein
MKIKKTRRRYVRVKGLLLVGLKTGHVISGQSVSGSNMYVGFYPIFRGHCVDDSSQLVPYGGGRVVVSQALSGFLGSRTPWGVATLNNHQELGAVLVEFRSESNTPGFSPTDQFHPDHALYDNIGNPL